MTPAELFVAVMARLGTGRFATHETRPEKTPTVPYRVLYPDPGLASWERLGGYANRLRWRIRVICVARTRAGVLDVVTETRDLLTDWRPDPSPGASLLTENDIGALILTDGPPGDTRDSLTLQFSLHTHRSIP